ncbi:hypothetical protein BJF85_06535 [Saccharomonospora sp. CUA-673]|uniref:helix-turn-helix domain-containing protein n=1 Tax=Saccharomonospora sp. CUA-673 TaxID=1904969 RepID=UPI00095B0B3F|nr:helix-turn-helix domain-containing protein [Saccharomonospora sp. CUA-673]OLT39998.1 hypothetical protein BJF85_06535 [Saccharomonospora sp. CUA-673]
MPETSLRADVSSTDGLAPSDSRERWRQIATTYQCRMTCEFPDDDTGASTLRRTKTDRNQVLAWRSPRVRYRRTSTHMRQDAIDSYILLVADSGTADISVDTGRLAVHPGHGALVATTRPFDVTHTPYAELRAVTVERRTIRQRLSTVDDPVIPLDLMGGLGGIVQDTLDSTLRVADQLSAHEFDAVIDRLVELVCVLVETDTIGSGDHLGELEAAIRRHVRDNAQDPNLNSELIAGALGWSVRQIQSALQRSGTTCRELIKQERLSIAHERLSSPAYRGMSVTELAYHCGFSTPARFSTAFKEHFGMTPRDLRAAGASNVPRTQT